MCKKIIFVTNKYKFSGSFRILSRGIIEIYMNLTIQYFTIIRIKRKTWFTVCKENLIKPIRGQKEQK